MNPGESAARADERESEDWKDLHAELLVAAIERGLADGRAGRVIDDDELGPLLDAEFGPLE